MQSAPKEDEPIEEEKEMEEPSKEEEYSDEEIEESENVGEKLREIGPITIEQELWDGKKNMDYDVFGEMDPIIRDGDLAILPVLLDTDHDMAVSFNRLFGQSGGTGEGIASQQGYDIRHLI